MPVRNHLKTDSQTDNVIHFIPLPLQQTQHFLIPSNMHALTSTSPSTGTSYYQPQETKIIQQIQHTFLLETLRNTVYKKTTLDENSLNKEHLKIRSEKEKS